MAFVIPAPTTPVLDVKGTEAKFPVHRIYCIGRNFAAHAREMGHDPEREPPFFFQKPADALLPNGGDFPYPAKTSDLHFELELVVALGKGGVNIEATQALDHVYGYAVGIDMTRRDLQAEAKKLGRPWEVGKAFEKSAPCSAIVPASQIGHPSKGSIWLTVNGKTRQRGDLSQLIWSIPESISYLSSFFTLAPGDLLFTGTPAGVGATQRGDRLQGGVDGVGEIEIRVV
ncbi:MAG TPA: fumarylacetoacetate hydrolase family protein [Candidatus Binatia bacterium]|jgi:fumarylpyruvate hydrolase